MPLHGLAAAIGLTLVVACYEPRYAECVVRCQANSECAPDQVCGGDGWCASTSGLAGRCFQSTPEDAPVIDSGIPVDARVPPRDAPKPPTDTKPPVDAALPPVDAVLPPPDTSPPDAPPTCGADCPGTCQNGVCVIKCHGPWSCTQGVVCPESTPCRVECKGYESCHGKVFCGDGPCTVLCDGKKSCKKGVRCEEACACDVTCAGEDSCRTKATCPAAACRDGDGCTSQPSGCSDC